VKYLIKIQTNQGEVLFQAANIVSASQFIAEAHQNYHNWAMKVGRDYNITLLTENSLDEDFDNNEVERYDTFPIRVGIIA